MLINNRAFFLPIKSIELLLLLVLNLLNVQRSIDFLGYEVEFAVFFYFSKLSLGGESYLLFLEVVILSRLLVVIKLNLIEVLLH